MTYPVFFWIAPDNHFPPWWWFRTKTLSPTLKFHLRALRSYCTFCFICYFSTLSTVWGFSKSSLDLGRLSINSSVSATPVVVWGIKRYVKENFRQSCSHASSLHFLESTFYPMFSQTTGQRMVWCRCFTLWFLVRKASISELTPLSVTTVSGIQNLANNSRNSLMTVFEVALDVQIASIHFECTSMIKIIFLRLHGPA